MKYNLIYFFMVLFFTSTAGATGMQSLEIGADGRSSGMGMIHTAFSQETGGYSNPAGLPGAGKTGQAVTFSTLNWIEDVSSHFFSLSRFNNKNGWGLSLLYTDVPGIEHRIVASENPVGTFNSHEVIAGFSYGYRLNRQLSLGATIQAFYQKLFVDDAYGGAVDIGGEWQWKAGGPSVSFMLSHLGKTAELKDESIELPLTVKLGTVWPIPLKEGHLLAAMDLLAVRDDGLHLHAGMEYRLFKQLFLRGGYQTGYALRSFTGGMGIAWHHYRIDYAYLPLSADFGNSHRLSFCICR